MGNDTVRGSPFSRLAQWVARRSGHPAAFLAALALVAAWAASGPWFGFGDTWQLAINTVTTIATFLMVFLIQNQQTRDSEAMHVKLDELIESTPGARRDLLDLEEMPEEELHRLQRQYEALAAQARRHRGESRTRRTTKAPASSRQRRRASPKKGALR